ncbi:hypothetical protein [Georgenia sp. SUBG003]|uniref:hypothetical protein n=1 Tax=Georgenia sp. SUBG003 TaxID=1497974 RepID=UPI0004D7E21E|nr:hypothetical protein DA06_26800 [Georgenia sp. SUBG003]
MDFFLYSKFGQMILAVIVFAAVIAIILGLAQLADRYSGRSRTSGWSCSSAARRRSCSASASSTPPSARR